MICGRQTYLDLASVDHSVDRPSLCQPRLSRCEVARTKSDVATADSNGRVATADYLRWPASSRRHNATRRETRQMKRRAREGVLCNAKAALEIDQSNRINEYGSADSRIVLRLRVASYKWVYRIMKCPLFGTILFFYARVDSSTASSGVWARESRRWFDLPVWQLE